MAVLTQRTRGAIRTMRLADLHREVQHGVIVVAEFPAGRQGICELPDPALAPALCRVRLSFHAAEPSGDVVINNHGSLAVMERKVGGCSVRAHARERAEAFLGCRHTARRSNGLRGPIEQRAAPVETQLRGDATDRVRTGVHEGLSRREALGEGVENALGLLSAGALEEGLSDQRQPRIGCATP